MKSSLIVTVVLVSWLLAGNAFAGRKRLVVLELDGPKAEKFHGDLVKLLKKNHTVISVDKWNAKAEELDAAKITEKNVKKVAKKLKIDGVVYGKIEKRRDEYILRLKLRSGATGEILGNSVQTKADGPRLDGQAQRDIKEELVSAIDELESNHGGGDDEEDDEGEAPRTTEKDVEEGSRKSGFGGRRDKDDEESSKKDDERKRKDEEKAERKRKDEDEKAEKAAKKDRDKEDDEEESSKRDDEVTEERPKKRKASRDEDEGEGEGDGVEESSGEVDDVDAELKVAPSRRAIDAVVGLSFTARNLSFKYSGDLGKPPPGYKQAIPVAGALVDITAYPLSFNHKPKGIISGIGLNVLYDQVLKINSQKKYADGMGVQQTANLTTKENRWSVGAVLRYPLGTNAKAIVIGGRLAYGKQVFTVDQKLPNDDPTDIPNVNYTMITPGAFVQAPVLPKITLNAEAMFHLITNTGEIQTQAQYGPSTVTGFEIMLGADYMLMKNVFVRAGFRYETIGFKFKGTDPMAQTHTRDTDPDQDVQGARDTYMGGAATVGYVY